MDEQGSWKGQTFTLVIFGGIVVLCSIFFILGMLVGRTQVAAVADPSGQLEEDAAVPEEPGELDFTFYESVDESTPPLLEAPAAPSEPARAEPEPETAPAADSAEDGAAITLQIAALSSAEQAERLRAEIAGKGFPSFVLRPANDDPAALHRVQVGPFRRGEEADRVKALLEAEGYRPIVRN